MRDRNKKIQAVRTSLVKPLKDYIKNVLEAYFNKFQNPIEEADAIMSQKINAWREKERVRIEAEQRKERERIEKEKQKEIEKLQKKAEKKGEEVPAEKIAEIEQAKEDELAESLVEQPEKSVAGMTFKKHWVFVVEDISKLPVAIKHEGVEYAVRAVAEVEANKAIRAGCRNIPGLRIYEEEYSSL